MNAFASGVQQALDRALDYDDKAAHETDPVRRGYWMASAQEARKDIAFYLDHQNFMNWWHEQERQRQEKAA